MWPKLDVSQNKFLNLCNSQISLSKVNVSYVFMRLIVIKVNLRRVRA